MTNAFKKAFTGAVAVLTIVWSMGISALVAPMQVNAASEGDVIKGTTLSTVYYYGTDGSRYAFPNEKTYFSWYTDFSEVETISDSALAAIPLAGNIVYRPGSRWIKIQSDPKTYAVTPEGTIRWVETEEVAEGLAGTDWNAFIDDVSDTFFVDYTVGTSLMSADDAYEGALVLDGTEIYMVWEGEKLLVSDAGMTGNNLQSRFVLDGSGVDLDSMTSGTSLTSENTAMTNTAQLGASVTTGGLSVSLASDTAASATVPALANAVSFATYKLTATDGDVDVSQMVVKMNGLASIDNLTAVYLYNGDTRLTNSRTVNSSTRSVTFGSLDLTVADGETEYITVRADMAGEADVDSGSTAYFSLESADSVTTDADVSGSFPVSGHSMTFSTTEVGTLTVEKSGTVSDVTLGEDQATIGKFKFSTDSTEAASLEAVTFNVDQASDHSNYKLYKSTTLLATGEVGDGLVTFSLSSPLEIEKSGDETLTLKADIGGQATDEITTYIEETSDVMAVGGTYGFNLDINIEAVDNNDDADDSEFTIATIEGGDLTFAFNGPSATDIAIDSDQQSLLYFTVTSGNWTEIQELPVILTVTSNGADAHGDLKDGSDANYLNLAIRETDGTLWMGPLDVSEDDDSETFTFDDYQTLEAGESIDLMVTVDIADNEAMDAATVNAALVMGSVVAEDANGDEITDIVPSANITGYNMTVTTSSVVVTIASTPSSGTYVKGTSDVSVVGYSFAAGDNSDMTVAEATFTVVGDSDGSVSPNENDIASVKDHISSCSVYDSSTGTLVDGPESFDNLGSESIPENQMTFTGMDWTVAAGETSKLLLKCTFSNNALDAGSGSNDAYNFFIANHDDLSITNESGDSVDASVTSTFTVGDNTTVTGLPVITEAATGTLAVAVASDMPTSTVVLGDSTDVVAAKYKFTATNESFTVKELSLVNTGGSDTAISTVRLSYPKADGTTGEKEGYLSGGAVSFTNLDFYVSSSAYKTLTVYVDTNTVSTSSATSGAVFGLDIDMAAGELVAYGDSGLEVLSGGAYVNGTVTDDILANNMTLRKTKPTLSLNSASPSGDGMPELAEVLRFNVAADSRGDVELNSMVFKVTATDKAGDNWNYCTDAMSAPVLEDEDKFTVYNTDDISTEIDAAWDFYTTSGAACGNSLDLGYAEVTFAANEYISAGYTNTYSLEVDTTDASSDDGDRVRFEIVDQDEADDLSTDAISWDDSDTGVTADGSYIKNLPVTGGTISY